MKALTPVLLACLLFAGCGRGKEQAAQEPPPPIVLGPADVAVVVLRQIRTGPALTGTLTAEQQATVRAQMATTVLETYAEPGQPVRQGEALARLDTAALRDDLASAQSGVTNARSNLALTEREEERQRELGRAGIVAARDVEIAHQRTVAARSSLAQARAQLASAQEQLGHTRIDAPFSGVVSERLVSGGDVVQPGTALYTVVDPETLQLEASIPAEQLSALRIGAPIEFTVNGFGDRTFRGQITRINPSADPATRQVRVYAEVPNAGGELVAGLFAEGRVATESRLGLTLPADAIDRRMAKPAVLAVRNSRVERIEVQLGLADEREQRVEVRNGVRQGEVVLRSAAQGITPGTPVQLSPAVQQTSERLAQNL
ncbi:MAG TPA: efflux RND transporter periplasmic adaptor subunit [Thermoanaerobaculia bacterium]|nr:efflux RND transporter periplasmic adaptor subunit [Thermoanaerobaculia bacterium]